jgi:RNA polymerase sigma-54 factor
MLPSRTSADHLGSSIHYCAFSKKLAMPVEISLQTKLRPQILMTPKLQQAIHLLLCSRQELVHEIQRALMENPFLEEREPEQEQIKTEQERPSSDDKDSPWKRNEVISTVEWEEYLGEFSSSPQTAQQEYEPWDKSSNVLEACHSAEPSLEAHLLAQLLPLPIDPVKKRIGECIIGNLDDTGYLAASDNEIAELAGCTAQEVPEVLSLIQNFDPVGVAARSLSECLLIQLHARNEDNDEILTCLLRQHLEDIEKHRFKPLLKKFHIDEEKLRGYISVIQSLEPRPGSSFGSSHPCYISPDIFVRKIDGDFVISLNEEDLPQIQLSPMVDILAAQAKGYSDKEHEFMDSCRQSAIWIIRSLEERQMILCKVMESIVRRQRDFFEHGVYGLKPLILKDVAADIGRSESSISRITTNKYVQTPHGIFELKYFFNSGLEGKSGSQVGSESVKARIRALIAGEDPDAPLSDEDISTRINSALGVKVARRTVAKYRESLGLPPASKRRKLL